MPLKVRRLRHHPSILIWAGNNENEAAISTNWYNTDPQNDLYSNDYRALYIDTVMKTVSSVDAFSRPFLSSSPTNGLESTEENYLAKNPYDLRYGDMHFYDYKMNGWDSSAFVLPRFMSEYGVQSLPSYSTLSDVYSMPQDADIFGKLNEHRQHHAGGNQQIMDEIQNNLKLPIGSNATEIFMHTIYLSQINQAMHLRTGSELFRRMRNQLDKKTGQGLCSGTMYWQFNDLWQAPTWSSIEYVANDFVKGGKWKMAHYFVKKAYASFMLSPDLTSQSVDIYVISDLTRDLKLTFTLSFYSYSSMAAKFVQNYEIEVKPLSAGVAFSMSISEIEAKLGCSPSSNDSCILIAKWSDPVDFTPTSNFLLFKNKLAEVENLRVPNLGIQSVSEIENVANAFKIVIQTDQVSLFTWLDVNTSRFLGTFSDNGFHMTEATRTIVYQVESDQPVSIDDFKSNLSVKSLANIYV
jgi:beta-mannosidase